MHEINHIVSSIGFLQNVSQKLYVNLRQKVNYVNIYSQKERFCSTSLNLAQFAQSLLLNIAKKKQKKNTATWYLLHHVSNKRIDAESNFRQNIFYKNIL